TVKAIMTVRGRDMMPGDVYLSNNPYKGGSHLPDVTAVSPVFSGEDVISYVAARGHHADIGGITPGSVPSQVSHIDEEGVLIDCLTAVRDGLFQEVLLREVLSGHRYPVRDCDERILDLRAQVAACEKGRAEVHAVVAKYGLETIQEYMRHIQDNGANEVRQALGLFVRDAGTFDASFDDVLDDGTPVRARVVITAGDSPPETVQAVVDFSGTGAQHLGDNLNAPLSVTRSAVLYVLRAILGSDIPLNSGCLRPVRLIVPEGSLLNPAYPAPVAAGNIETSQRIVDVLLGALGVAAASQGTMNNLLFEVEGDAPYYETIAGGSGGVEGCPGASGVQVHMTNTRITDPEVLEFRHPDVRLERFTLRRGSGGTGAFPGGDGVIREIRFLRRGHVTLITERRTRAPYGAQGGAPGAKGVNFLRGADGKIVTLPHRVSLEVSPGDSIIIETPGGGGFGRVT
ncbi:MAG TPA: hydantoinase B/oxoprolinase family protein, partial [Dissulfurispiraceae bacterium]|nr:hydantoinase B/oxoprolinase family protein [Dissulfurispiraceae bacterium]